MDNVRNAVGNPLAGIDPEELVDTRPYCKMFTGLPHVYAATLTRTLVIWQQC
jgi:hypothetical protein